MPKYLGSVKEVTGSRRVHLVSDTKRAYPWCKQAQVTRREQENANGLYLASDNWFHFDTEWCPPEFEQGSTIQFLDQLWTVLERFEATDRVRLLATKVSIRNPEVLDCFTEKAGQEDSAGVPTSSVLRQQGQINAAVYLSAEDVMNERKGIANKSKKTYLVASDSRVDADWFLKRPTGEVLRITSTSDVMLGKYYVSKAIDHASD